MQQISRRYFHVVYVLLCQLKESEICALFWCAESMKLARVA